MNWKIKQKIDLTKGINAGQGQCAIAPISYAGDSSAHVWEVTVLSDGAPVTVSESISALFIRPNGDTVAQTGTHSDNIAAVTIPQAVYAYEGIVHAVMRATVEGTVTTIGAIAFEVMRSTTGSIIDPGSVVPDLTQLLAEIENMREATADANAAVAVASQYDMFVDSFVMAGARSLQSVTYESSGTYWNCEGTTAYKDTVASDSFKAYDPVSVAAGEVYTIYSSIGLTHKARPWLVTDDEYNILTSSGDQYGEPTQRYVIVVPEGGTKLLLTDVSSGGPYLRKLDMEETLGTNALKYQASLQAAGITDLSTCREPGWYGCGAAYVESITDLPPYIDTGSALNLFVVPYAYNSGASTSGNNNFIFQMLINRAGQMYQRDVQVSSGNATAWTMLGGGGEGSSSLYGKKVAIIGDSISTNGNSGANANVPEITVEAADVGVELSAWVTHWDIYNDDGNSTPTNLTIGGHTFTAAEIGTEVSFTPVEADVGKSVGRPRNYNLNSTTVWWEVLMHELGIVPIPVCWSGSSITSHEGSSNEYKTSYAWHEAQIRKCGIRTAGTMTRTAPDVIIIYRGTNDFSHEDYALLTDGYFDSATWDYPSTDVITGGYGYKEGLCLTVKNLRAAYPNAKIFLCTLNVFKRVHYSHFPTNNGVNTLPQYNNAIREVADFLGCGVIEFDQDGITFENCYSGGYITDSATIPTHPSDLGHKVMGLKAVADLTAQYSPMA